MIKLSKHILDKIDKPYLLRQVILKPCGLEVPSKAHYHDANKAHHARNQIHQGDSSNPPSRETASPQRDCVQHRPGLHQPRTPTVLGEALRNEGEGDLHVPETVQAENGPQDEKFSKKN